MEYFHISAKNIFIFPQKKFFHKDYFTSALNIFILPGAAQNRWKNIFFVEENILCGRKYFLLKYEHILYGNMKIFDAEENILCGNIYSLREYIFIADFFLRHVDRTSVAELSLG